MTRVTVHSLLVAMEERNLAAKHFSPLCHSNIRVEKNQDKHLKKCSKLGYLYLSQECEHAYESPLHLCLNQKSSSLRHDVCVENVFWRYRIAWNGLLATEIQEMQRRLARAVMALGPEALPCELFDECTE